MHIGSLIKSRAFILVFIVFAYGLTFGAEKDMVQFQGVLMTVDLKKHSMVVNEKLCVWNHQTIINDAKGSPATFERLQAKNWVYIEGVYEKPQHRIVAKTIYLLPNRIDEKEKGLYPFIQ